jgi:hypothetical protein
VSDAQLQYDDVPLGRALWPSMLHFLTAEVPLRYVLDVAIRKYLDRYAPVALKLWGGGTLVESRLLLKNLGDDRKPMLMYWFWLISPSPNPYESRFSHVDLFLAAGRAHEEYLAKLGVPKDKIVSVGVSRYDHLAEFKSSHTPHASRLFLRIPADYSFYILYDANTWLRGFLAVSEQVQVTNSLLQVFARHPRAALLVKPHPAHETGVLEQQVTASGLGNVFLLNRSMSPNHALNASDLLITKCSMIAIEAMSFEKPVVSVILDREIQFQQYGDAAEYVFSLDDLDRLVSRLLDDAHFRDRWSSNQRKAHKAFLTYLCGDGGQPASTRAAAAIDESIRHAKNARPAPQTLMAAFQSRVTN